VPPARPTYPAGSRIDAVDLARHLGRVEGGLLAVVDTDRRGQQAVVDLRGAGAVLDVGCLLAAQEPGPAYGLEALLPTRVRWLDAAPLRSADAGDLTVAVLAVLAARTRRQHGAACRRRLQTGPQRVAELLVDLSREAALDGSPALERLSRFDLARIVGLSRSAVSTFCARFERRGWCRLLGETGAFLDVDALSAYAARGLFDVHDRRWAADHDVRLWSLAASLTPALVVDVA
jgi:CRP-like cAMP-binding protein